MKVRTSIGIASLVSLMLAAPAWAVTIDTTNPPNVNFTASGPTSLTKNGITISCTSTFNGNVNGGSTADITSASFSGSNILCYSISAANLPWTLTATSTTTATVSGVQVNTPLGNCGPSTINATWDNSTKKFTFTSQSLSGGCTVSGVLTAPLIDVY